MSMDPVSRIRALLRTYAPPLRSGPLFLDEDRPFVDELVARLESDAALASLAEDPYWPKWDSPWWWITLLFELGLARRIPKSTAEALAIAIDTHYPHHFPFDESELPPGKDFYRHVICHCALGTVVQVLDGCGIATKDRLPWARPWFLRYQLPDGGLNCDEAAYTKPQPHSSIVSTLPALEAMLGRDGSPLDEEAEAFLDRGAGYLLARRLWRSLSRDGAIIHADWALSCFPRFYDYDLLRGLHFLVRWALRRGKALPAIAIEEPLSTIAAASGPGGAISPGRRCWEGARSRGPDETGPWNAWVPARAFPLLEATGQPGRPSQPLSADWHEVLDGLARLDEGGRLV